MSNGAQRVVLTIKRAPLQSKRHCGKAYAGRCVSLKPRATEVLARGDFLRFHF